jgi:hypothetical protein
MIRVHDSKVVLSVLLPGSERPDWPLTSNWFCLDRWKIRDAQDEPACLVSHADGMVWAVSFRTGDAKPLRPQDLELQVQEVQMAVAGDLDGDGVADYWIGTYAEGNPDPAVMRAISGADSHTIYACGRTYQDLCSLDVDPRAGAIAAVGDVDGDGVCDALMGTSYAYGGQQGAAFLVSGKSGKVIFGLTRKGEGVSVIRP